MLIEVCAKIRFNKNPTNWWGRQNAGKLKFDKKPWKAEFLAVFFSKFEKCRPDVADDVISGVTVEWNRSAWMSL